MTLRLFFVSAVLALFTGQSQAQNVWPGDANRDNEVTLSDYFFTAGAYGRTGPARAQQGILWQGYAPPTQWATSSAYQGQDINDRYLDA